VTSARAIDTRTPELPAGVTPLIAHIVDTHHAFETAELGRLAPLADKVLRAHGARHPELQEVARLLAALSADLLPHMRVPRPASPPWHSPCR
jgi:regulator of cell morphogenesis and NO signaling